MIRSDIPPSVFRVFVAVLALASAGKPVTVSGLARRLGLRSPNSVWYPLQQLKRRGLVDYDYGTQSTIRPLMRLELC